MAVYLLHFDEPIGGAARSSAQHYIGSCEPWQFNTRMRAHKNGTSGSRIVAAFHKRKISFTVARLWWDGGRALEKYLKANGHFDQLCPVCTNKRMIQTTADIAALANDGKPQAAQHLQKRMSASGGVRRRGNPTDNIGLFQAELPLESSTGSGDPDLTEPPTTGGSTTHVAAPPTVPSGQSVGTRRASPSKSRP